MASVKELQQENQDIINMAAVLAPLVELPELRSNPIFCELLQKFMGKIGAHLSHESSTVYKDLLADSNRESQNVASQFISNTHELQKILDTYTRRWCVAIPSFETQEAFIDETNEVFRLLNERIDLENAHLFPYIGQ